MKVQVVIEKNIDGTYTAVIKNQFKNVGFFGNGATVEEAMNDLRQSESEAREFDPNLPVLEYEVTNDFTEQVRSTIVKELEKAKQNITINL